MKSANGCTGFHTSFFSKNNSTQVVRARAVFGYLLRYARIWIDQELEGKQGEKDRKTERQREKEERERERGERVCKRERDDDDDVCV